MSQQLSTNHIILMVVNITHTYPFTFSNRTKCDCIHSISASFKKHSLSKSDFELGSTNCINYLVDEGWEGWEGCDHPILVCVNLVFNTWRILNSKNSKRVPCGHACGSIVVLGELRAWSHDIYLCVLGDVMEEVEHVSGVFYPFVIAFIDSYIGSRHYYQSRKFAVASLSEGIWVIPDGRFLHLIGRLGMHPRLTKYHDPETGREPVLILCSSVNTEEKKVSQWLYIPQ